MASHSETDAQVTQDTPASPSSIDIHEILTRLPHRYPFLLIDRVLELERGKRILGLKNVTMNEPFFVGHFPHRPVMPGVMILEALAQAAAIFDNIDVRPDGHTVFYFAGIENARFRRPVEPGDQLMLHANLDRMKAGIVKFTSVARVGDVVVAEAGLTCTMRRV
jgi:3-hydroxyacyl-[acyl-carrier-protein] dehydratase